MKNKLSDIIAIIIAVCCIVAIILLGIIAYNMIITITTLSGFAAIGMFFVWLIIIACIFVLFIIANECYNAIKKYKKTIDKK